MYLDKQDAINLAKNARAVIDNLQNTLPHSLTSTEEREKIRHTILDLEYNLEKLDEAIEKCPTKIKNDKGEWI